MGYGFGNRIAVGRMAITAQAQTSEPAIQKVAIFGGGLSSYNGEYIWDGTYVNGWPQYTNGVYLINYVNTQLPTYSFQVADENLYINSDFTLVKATSGSSPYVTSSNSINSEVKSITFLNAGTSEANGTYTWDGETYVNGRPKYENPNGSWIEWTGEFWAICKIVDFEAVQLYYADVSAPLANGVIQGNQGVSPIPSVGYVHYEDFEPVIWKVAISSAGTASSNGEYVWDGSQVSEDGTKIYNSSSGPMIYFNTSIGEPYSNKWVIDDNSAGDYTYYSDDLITWVSNGYGTAPTSSLTFVRNQWPSLIELTGEAGDPSINGTYEWDGTISNVYPKLIRTDDSNFYIESEGSGDGINYIVYGGEFEFYTTIDNRVLGTPYTFASSEDPPTTFATVIDFRYPI